MTTKTLRLPDQLVSAIRNVGVSEHMDESVAMRKLLYIGYGTYIAEQYRLGRISLRTAAKELDLSLSETMDTLNRMGINGNVSADDTLQSLKSLLKSNT